jgi:hypothetical protein
MVIKVVIVILAILLAIDFSLILKAIKGLLKNKICDYVKSSCG